MKTRAKDLFFGAALLLLCLSLAACVEIQMKFDLRADGSGTAEWTVEIPKASADSLGLTAEKIKAKMLEDRQFQKPGVNMSTGRAASGNEMVTVSMPFTSVQELSSNDLRFEFQKTPDGRQCTFRIDSRPQPVPVEVRAEVRMPGRILSANADQVSGNVARFQNLFRAGGVQVQSEIGGVLSGTTLALLLGGAAAIVVMVGLLVWLSKRRAQAAPAAVGPSPGAVYCRQCGADNKPGAKFCRNCGAPLTAPVPEAPPAPARCPRCDAVVTPGKRFCPRCGTPLGTVPAPPPTPAQPPAWEAPPQVPEWVAPERQPAKTSIMMIALGASLVLLLLAIVLLVYRLFFQDRPTTPSASTTPAVSSPQPAAEAPAQPVTPPSAEAQPGPPVTPEQQANVPAPVTRPAQPASPPAASSQSGRPSPMPSPARP